jgi:hypothetical protein
LKGRVRYEMALVPSPKGAANIWVGVAPVRNREYRIFCTETHHALPERFPGSELDEAPVVGVSAFDALDFCEWFSPRAGLLDRELWKRCALAGETSRYWWGDDESVLAKGRLPLQQFRQSAKDQAGGRAASQSVGSQGHVRQCLGMDAAIRNRSGKAHRIGRKDQSAAGYDPWRSVQYRSWRTAGTTEGCRGEGREHRLSVHVDRVGCLHRRTRYASPHLLHDYALRS